MGSKIRLRTAPVIMQPMLYRGWPSARMMAVKQVRRLPVLEAGKVVGMVSLGDLAKCGACEMEAGEALSEISENIQRTRGLHQPERD